MKCATCWMRKAAIGLSVGALALGIAVGVSADGKDKKKPKALKKVYLADAFEGKTLANHWKPVRIYDTKADRIMV